MSGTGIIDAAKLNPAAYGKTASVGKKICNRRVGYREGVIRILEWHTNAGWIKAYVSAWNLEWIGRKRHS
jgi:hypothetical protein